MHSVAALLALLPITPALAAPSSSIDLGGTWKSIALQEPSFPPADAPGWAEVQIPKPVNAAPWVCQRREFEIPFELRGQRLYLRFTGVKYTARVRCNGKIVGEHAGGYEPFECDITPVAKVGGTNTVEVLCGSWKQLTSDPGVDVPLGRDGIESQGDWVLYPIGSHVQSMGIWDPVTLEARPDVYVEDVYVATSFRKKLITVETTIRNVSRQPAEISLAQHVERDGEELKQLGETVGHVEPFGTLTLTQQSRWTDPPLWWPDDPQLLHVKSALAIGGRTADAHSQRFGFREMWAKGPMFVLNGVPLHIRGNSCHPLGYAREDAERTYEICRQGNINAFRLHAQPWSQAWYDVADEQGMLIMHETAVWCYARSYALANPVFWGNFSDHIRAQIKRHRSRPSVFSWSLENEILHVGGNRVPECEDRLADLADVAREVDPTRLINYDGDADPNGAADIINLHYAHNFPNNRLWPNDCYWLDSKRVVEGWPRKPWRWSRKKPLYIGEYLWSPSSTPDKYTMLYGDEAYEDVNWYRRAAKGQAWRYQIEAYRAQGMSGGCPWNIFEGGKMDPEQNPMYWNCTLAYRPQCALVNEWNSTFYSGAEVDRTVTFINDVLRPAELRAEVSCSLDGVVTFRTGMDLEMKPAEIVRKVVSVGVPQVAERAAFEMVFTLSENGTEIFRESRSCWAMPGAPAPVSDASLLAIYDPNGSVDELLAEAGIANTAITDLSAIPAGARCLLIGENALKPTRQASAVVGAGGEESALATFARSGGRVIILAQEHLPAQLPATLMPDGSTIAFVRRADHPVTEGCAADDFALWAPDHIVSYRDIERPSRAGARVIVDAGGAAGMERALLLEVDAGKGSYVFCQLALAEKSASEPIARQTLHRLIADGLGTGPAARKPLIVMEEGDAARNALTALGLDAVAYGDLAPDAAHASGILVDGDDARASADDLSEFAAAGGTVWLHGPSQDFLSAMGLAWDGASWDESGATDVQALRASPLASGLRNEDLYWLADVRPKRHANWSLTPGIANHVLRPSLAGDVTDVPVSAFDIPDGRLIDEGIWLYRNGAISAPISIAADGTYVIGVTAGGPGMGGVYPAYLVHVDDQLVGGFQALQSDPLLHTVVGQLTAGDHVLKISFTNDASNPPDEDRNGLIAGASFAAAKPLPEGAVALTDPPILVEVSRGEGRYLIDGINWPATGLNAMRSSRLVATLATNLGIATRAVASGTPISLADWTLDPEAVHVRHEPDGGLYFGDTAWAEGMVRFAEAGAYSLAFEARGPQASGEYPEVLVEIDGEALEPQHLISEGWHEVVFRIDLDAGRHTIRVHFTNDIYDQALHLDRNLWIRKLTAALDERGDVEDEFLDLGVEGG